MKKDKTNAISKIAELIKQYKEEMSENVPGVTPEEALREKGYEIFFKLVISMMKLVPRDHYLSLEADKPTGTKNFQILIWHNLKYEMRYFDDLFWSEGGQLKYAKNHHDGGMSTKQLDNAIDFLNKEVFVSIFYI